MGNAFTNAATSLDSRTWNDAVSHSTSGSKILDYFAKCGSYRTRPIDVVGGDLASMFAEDANLALKVIFYNRMITRRVRGFAETETVQRGQGQRDEFIKSLAWLEVNYPNYLYEHLWMVPAVGRWSDLWYDSAASGVYHYVNTDQVYPLVAKGMVDKNQRALIAKFLPKIRSRKNIKNDRHLRLNNWARNLCEFLGWNDATYRRFKSDEDNKAHAWQRQMCAGQWNAIDFQTIPGKALFNLITKRGKDSKTTLERHNLEKAYLAWIETQPVAKFTGYPYELYQAARGGTSWGVPNRTLVQTYTLNKQFDGLIQLAEQNVDPEVLNKGVLCALDTSGSMHGAYGMDVGIAPIDICCGLGIYFSSLLQGAFADHVIMFDNKSQFKKLEGNFCNKVDQLAGTSAMGGTNFQSVIDEICRVRKQNPNIPVEDYPEILLCVSDMQFNPATPSGSYWSWNTDPITHHDTETNYKMATQKLAAVGLPEMTFIWWQVNGTYTKDVPVKMTDPGTVLISGFDGAIVTAILGGQEEIVDKVTGEKRKLNPYEQMVKALDQEILNKIKV